MSYLILLHIAEMGIFRLFAKDSYRADACCHKSEEYKAPERKAYRRKRIFGNFNSPKRAVTEKLTAD